jgi:hypothetical protein
LFSLSQASLLVLARNAFTELARSLWFSLSQESLLVLAINACTDASQKSLPALSQETLLSSYQECLYRTGQVPVTFSESGISAYV